MANLHVQPKRKSFAWLWIIILILIIGGAIYYFAVYKQQEHATTTTLRAPSSLQLQIAKVQSQKHSDVTTVCTDIF